MYTVTTSLFSVLRPNVVRCAACCCCRIPLGCEQSTYNLSTHTHTHCQFILFIIIIFAVCVLCCTESTHAYVQQITDLSICFQTKHCKSSSKISRLHIRHTRTHACRHTLHCSCNALIHAWSLSWISFKYLKTHLHSIQFNSKSFVDFIESIKWERRV